MAYPVRRTTRKRKANTQYDDQVEWNEDTLRLLRASSESSDRSSTTEQSEEEVLVKQKDIGFDDEQMEDLEDRTAMRAPEEKDDFSDGVASLAANPRAVRKEFSQTPGTTPATKRQVKVRRVAKKREALAQGTRNRLVVDPFDKLRGAKGNAYPTAFGPGLEDLYPVLQTRDIWHIQVRDAVLPSRRSMRDALALDVKREYLQQPDAERELPTVSIQVGKQVNRPITKQDAATKRNIEDGRGHNIVLGPWENSKVYSLHFQQPFDLAQAWPRSSTAHPSSSATINSGQPSHLRPGGEPQPAPANGQTQINAAEAYHKGWLLDLGARPQCMVWAPLNSDDQCLAISFTCSQKQRDSVPPRHSKHAPAFSASPAYPSRIEIWHVKALPGPPDESARLNHINGPRLSEVVCTNWGNILQMVWAPLPPGELTSSSLRCMGTLSSDGNFRLITLDISPKSEKQYTEIESTECKARPPPTTVFTCFTFASHEDIIIGGADGAIYLYSFKDTSLPDLQPYMTLQIHNTYIMNVAVSSDHPEYVCTSCASGELTLTDLRSPNQDRVQLHRARLPTRGLSYIRGTRMFVTIADSCGNSEPTGTTLSSIVGHSLRHFYYANTLVRLPEMSGLCTTMATSPFHPHILVGNSQGWVFCTNHTRRCMLTRYNNERGSSYMVKLFEYDWRPLPEQEANSYNTNLASISQPEPEARKTNGTEHDLPYKQQPDFFHTTTPQPGMSRLHQGFRAHRIELGVIPLSNKPHLKGNNESEATPAASSQVVFHEEQAVTALAWNPNGRFCGWAVVGWGCGVCWIGDLGHDAM